MTLNRVWLPSPNYSSRGGAGVRLIVIHTAEGSRTFQSLGSFFANPGSGVSSHTGIDDTANTVGEYVKPDQKAWTAANANPVAIQTELCAFAAWDAAEWSRHPNMLANCKQWIAEEAGRYGIPIVKLTPAQAQGSGRGVCAHADLGSWGGGHTDPGPAFPWSQVLGGAPLPPTTSPTPPPSGGPAPAFPYPGGHYIGTARPDPACHSGCYGPPDSNHTSTWQRQMAARGWNIGVDGCYGPQSEQVCRQFQGEKGLGVDGLVGPQTWAAAWTSPVT